MNSGDEKRQAPDRTGAADASLERSGLQPLLEGATLLGAHRYRLLRKLGEGGQGAVYEAEDRDTGGKVAVKMLRTIEEGALSRFKREFRVRARIRHRSLAEVGELATHEGRWFLTMSLVQGIPLLRFTSALPRSEAKLRSCFAQLADGLLALHAAGLIHRDVKSDNVLVERDGRVVLLDLGLALEASDDQSTALIGTPAYMAPEQWAGKRPSAQSDWYAFGVLLFEALAGVAPFAGTQVELFLAKTQEPPPSVRTQAPDAPEDLALLCDGLLQRDPAQRFGATEVMRCFPALQEQRQSPPVHEPELIGRDAELAQLDEFLQQAERGRGTLVFVQGVSGIGKSALLRAFSERAGARGAWAFAGRCYERENVPFNAFDEALEELARLLQRRARTNLDVYRPRRTNLLSLVFPSLAVLQTKRRNDSNLPADPIERRAQAVAALLELLARMADDGPVVICLDDVHWADPDSVELMNALAHADFPLLLVVAFRSDEPQRPRARRLSPDGVVRLQALDEKTTHLLAQGLSERASGLSADELAALHTQTGGSPFLVCEWARFVKAHGAIPTQALRELLEARVAALTPAQHRLVSLIAVSREPVELQLAAHIAGCDDISDVTPLTRERLLRRLGRDGMDHLDVYHDRIREVICDRLSELEQRELHREVARELERDAAPAERRIAHHLAAGERDEAAALALEAAQTAEKAFAFARAAELYSLAIGLHVVQGPEPEELMIKRAQAWQNALRPKLAAESLREASARSASSERAAELLRLAGEQFLLGGDVEQGLRAVEQGLHDYGLVLASTPEDAIAEAFTLYARLEARGLEPVAGKTGSARTALCLSIARCLHHVDLRGIPFALRGLLEALDSSDERLLQEAYAVFVSVTASHLPNPLVAPALEHCRRLADRVATPYARALAEMASAEVEQFASNYTAAQRACERAERILLTECIGVSRELGQIRGLAVLMQHSSRGDFQSHLKRAIDWIDDADRRGNVFHGNWLRSACSLAWMAQDDPTRAREELARAEAAWPAARGGTFETACALFLDALDRYEDRPDVHLRPAQGRTSVLGSIVAQTPLLQGYLHLQRGWGCLRLLGTQPAQLTPEQSTDLLAQAQAAIDGLRALARAEWQAFADALEANLKLLGRAPAEADMLLERAYETFRATQYLACAACARRRRGELMSGELATRWVAEADAELEKLGVRNPARFARAYFSLF